MKHDTILDAFNAAAQATGSLIEPITEEMRKANDLDLQVVNARMATNIQNWIRDNPYVGGENEEEDGKAYNNYMQRFQTFVNGEYGKERWQNHSPYFQRMLQHMNKQTMEKARDYSLLEQDKWRIQREDMRNAEDIQNFISSGWEPQQVLEAVYDRINLSATKRQLDPQQINNMRQAAEIALYEKNMLDRVGQVNDVNNLEAAMQEVRDMFGFMPSTVLKEEYDEEGNITSTEELPWSFNGKEEWEKKILERETARIQGEHFEVFQEKDSLMKRLIVSGNIQEAINIAREWGAKWNKYYNTNNPEHANSNTVLLNRGELFFDIGRQLEGLRRQGSNGEKAAKIAVDPGRFIRATLPNGGGFVVLNEETGEGIEVESMKDAWEKFIFYGEEAFRLQNGYGVIADINWTNQREEWFQKFKSEMHQIIQEDQYKSLWSSYNKLLNYDTYNNSNRNNPYYLRGNMDKDARNNFIQDCIDFTFDLFWNGVNDHVELENRVRAFVVGDIDRNLNWARNPGTQEQRIRKMAAFTAEVLGGGANDQVFSKHREESAAILSMEPEEDDFVWRHTEVKRTAEAVRMEEWGYMARELGLSRSQLNPRWITSPDRERDPIPKGMFVVEEGDKAGTYRVNYDRDANMIYERYNSETRTWSRMNEVSESPRPPTRVESEERQRNEQREAAKNNLINELSNTQDRYERQNILEALRGVADDREIWRLGFNPITGAAANEIPANVWNEILRGMNQHEQEVQLNEWRQRGITRGIGR